MIKAVLFDIDGTIVNTEKVMTKSLQEALKEVLEISVSEKELEFIFALTSEKTTTRFTTVEKERSRLHEKWRDNIKARMHEAKIFDGIEHVLARLHEKSYPLGVVTSKNAEELVYQFSHLELSNYFEVVVTSSDTPEPKPSPQPIIKAMKQLQVAPEETIYIGDTINDLRSARDSGTHFALAGWGAKEDRALDKAENKLTTPKQLFTLLEDTI